MTSKKRDLPNMVRHTAVAVKKSPTSLPIRRKLAKIDQEKLKIKEYF